MDPLASDFAEVAHAQAVYNNSGAHLRRIVVREIGTGAVYENRPATILKHAGDIVFLPYPSEWSVEVWWKDRGGRHHFIARTYIAARYVQVVTDRLSRSTVLVVDDRPVTFTEWPGEVDLEFRPPLYETVSWWRW